MCFCCFVVWCCSLAKQSALLQRSFHSILLVRFDLHSWLIFLFVRLNSHFFVWYRCRIAVATIATISIPSLSPQFYLQTKLTQFKRFRIPNICKYLLNINRHNRFRWNIVRIAQVVMCLCAEWVEVKTCSTTSKHTNSLDTSSIFIYAIWQ